MLIDLKCPKCGGNIKLEFNGKVDSKPIVIDHGLGGHLLFVFLNSHGKIIRIDVLDKVIRIPTNLSLRDLVKLMGRDKLAKIIYFEISGCSNNHPSNYNPLISNYIRKLGFRKIKTNDCEKNSKKLIKKIKRAITKAINSKDPDKVFKEELNHLLEI